VVPERTFKRQNSMVKIWLLAPSHGTTGTVVNPALPVLVISWFRYPD